MKVASLVGSLLLAGVVPTWGAGFSSVDLRPLLQRQESSCFKNNGVFPLGDHCLDRAQLIT